MHLRVPRFLSASAIVLATAGCSAESDPGPLALGELYRCYENTSGGVTPASNYYMKFTEDRVLSTASDQPPEQVRTWFYRGEPGVGSERYDLEGNTVVINYDLASTFTGTIEGDRILFDVLTIDGRYVRNFALVRW